MSAGKTRKALCLGGFWLRSRKVLTAAFPQGLRGFAICFPREDVACRTRTPGDSGKGILKSDRLLDSNSALPLTLGDLGRRSKSPLPCLISTRVTDTLGLRRKQDTDGQSRLKGVGGTPSRG